MGEADIYKEKLCWAAEACSGSFGCCCWHASAAE